MGQIKQEVKYPKTSKDFQEQVKKLGVHLWRYRECHICESFIYFRFEGNDVFYDPNCRCRLTPMEKSSWERIAMIWNSCTNQDEYDRLNEFWKFNLEDTDD